MTAKTPAYGIEYLVIGEPVRNTRLALENNAKTIEAALLARGATVPGAADLAALAARVGTLENGRKRGQVRTGATNANGQVTVTHGLGVTPVAVLTTVATGFSTNVLVTRVVARTATTFTVASHINGAVNANGTIDFDWVAYA
jgi:hypothetical protein